MDCKKCKDNKNGWCESLKTNNAEKKNSSCKYLDKDYVVVKNATYHLEKMSNLLTLQDAKNFIDNALEKEKLFIIKIIKEAKWIY